MRLVGKGMDLTLLVRDTSGTPFETLKIPPLKILGELLGEATLEALPRVKLSASTMEACVEWTSLLLGPDFLGIDDDLSPPFSASFSKSERISDSGMQEKSYSKDRQCCYGGGGSLC